MAEDDVDALLEAVWEEVDAVLAVPLPRVPDRMDVEREPQEEERLRTKVETLWPRTNSYTTMGGLSADSRRNNTSASPPHPNHTHTEAHAARRRRTTEDALAGAPAGLPTRTLGRALG